MKIPQIHTLSKTSQISLLAVVILAGAIFFTVNSALQQQKEAGHASESNFLSNAGCESGTTGYKIYNSELSYVTSPVHSGSRACRVESTGGTSYGIVSTVQAPNPPQEQTYTGYAYVRANSSNVGHKVYVSLQEVGGSSSPRTTKGSVVTLTTSWQLVTNTMTIDSSGRTGLVFSVIGDPGVVNQEFYVDDMFFSLVGSLPTLVPTTAPTAIPTITQVPTAVPTGVPTTIPTNLPTNAPTSVPTSIPTNGPTVTMIPVDSPPAGSTLLNITLGLHGIGTAGDSANPGSNGNMTPLRPSRTITVEIYDAQNQLAVTQQGTVTYDPNIGKFTGIINLGQNFTTGLYTVKIKTDQFLRVLVPGIQTITAGQPKTLLAVPLVAGDINGDNSINIVDYNLLIGCYSDLLPAVDCTAANHVLADLNDDGNVNQFDYNLFLRELSNVGGQ